MDERLSQQSIEAIEQAIADGQEDGSLARDVSPSDHAALILATLNGILVQHHLITDLGPSAELLVDGDLLSAHGLEPLSDHVHPATGTTRHPDEAPSQN